MSLHSDNFARVLIPELVKGMARTRFRFSCRKNALTSSRLVTSSKVVPIGMSTDLVKVAGHC